ncbi:MAG: M14 family metallopeptidase [Planctomycetota bacterium]|nr:M14 family metallopeptidase [Planctomycetota bacterium]
MTVKIFNRESVFIKTVMQHLRLLLLVAILTGVGDKSVCLVGQTPAPREAAQSESADLALAEDLPTRFWPKDVGFDPAIPTPAEVIGFEIGQRHLNHAQLVHYLQVLADQSNRVSIETYASSHGKRPLLLLTITSPRNRDRLEEIRQQHRKLARPTVSGQVDTVDLPAVINMGYGVHGDEPSATNCAPLVAHYLAAAQGEEIERILDHCVILLDPSLNPDGFNRFANWTNAYRGRVPNPDSQDAEHQQNWPPGRVNYYWFDLNRDWLPAEHPESRGRLKNYHRWKPNVVLDFHEMGTNSTYFFQPGIPERTNPLTPLENVELTRQFADYHARALDQRGSLYYTQERFDDFYMGKGSTYPDLHGAVGILFEQASSRGHIQENTNGLLRFHETIANQFTTSLSSLRATVDLRQDLHEFKRSFYRDALKKARQDKVKTFIFSSPSNRTRLQKFAETLLRHDIRCYWPKEPLTVGDRTYAPEGTLVVPAEQAEYRFIRSLLMRRKSFQENVFYDVSSWTLPLAYDLAQFGSLAKVDVAGMRAAKLFDRDGSAFEPDPAARFYLVDWRDDAAIPLTQQLLRKGVNVKVALQPFSVNQEDEIRSYPAGTLLVPLGIQADKRSSIEAALSQGAARGAVISSAESGLTKSGIDFGSNNFVTLPLPKIAMPVAGGVSPYGAGERWHLLDTRVGAPVSMLKPERFQTADLDRYTILLFPTGRYGDLTTERWQTIRGWVSNGGTVVAVGSSGPSVAEAIQGDWATDLDSENGFGEVGAQSVQLPFDSKAKTRALQLISGAILNARVDLTHPLMFGRTRPTMPVFRNHTSILQPSDNPYCNPMIYDSEKPHLAGYCSKENLDKLKPSAAAVVYPIGQGRVVVIADNPNFRGFWHGASRTFLNAIYFGHTMNP